MKKAARYISLITIAFCLGVLARPTLRDLLVSPSTEIVSPRVSQFEGLNGPVDVILLGDSLTDHGRWSELTDLRIANRGIGRDTVRMIVERSQELPDAPVFIMAGINDLIAGRDVSEIVADFSRLLDRIQGREVVIQSVLGPENLRVEELNSELVRLANLRGVRFLDLTPYLGHPLRYSYDGVHLTADGYRIWASQIVTALDAI